MKLRSSFAIVDIEKGRHRLARRLQDSGPIEVVLRGRLTQPWGSDDGTSIEFNMEVTDIATV
jgi:hypothetical protein